MSNPLTIKNRYRELQFFHQRLWLAILFIGLLIVALTARLVYLQVQQNHLYQTLSNENQLSIIPLAPTRGLIYDRNGTILAENLPAFSLDIIPDKVNDLPALIHQLRQLIPISDNELQTFNKIRKQKRRYEPVPLKMKLNQAQVAKFAVHRWQFPGVEVNARLLRHYPEADTMAHVLGFVGRINADELRSVNRVNYSATNYIGKVGIEKYFETALHGRVGYQQVETNASGRILRELKHVAPIPGKNLYLTIDNRLQKVATAALANKEGAIIAMDPNNGDILAMVSQPSYDPNLFVQGMSTQDYQRLQKAEGHPLYNRAIRGLYPPGSIIKPFYGLAGLRSGVTSPEHTIYDPGYFKYANHTYRNWFHSGSGWVNLSKAITVSNDTYFYSLAVDLGIKRIKNLLHQFGFGKLTGVEMGEELSGTVPSPIWKMGHKGKHWYTGDTINVGIGQGYLLATPLQMGQATALLAKKGKGFQPRLIAQQESTTEINHTPTIALPPIHIDKQYWAVVIRAMRQVIESPQGTGRRFGRHPSYPVAAKTGTAQVVSLRHGEAYQASDIPKRFLDNSVFIAFAPVKRPKIAVAVVVEHNADAPLIARKVMDAYLLHHYKLNQSANNTPALKEKRP